MLSFLIEISVIEVNQFYQLSFEICNFLENAQNIVFYKKYK